jgi:hypothetical protein
MLGVAELILYLGVAVIVVISYLFEGTIQPRLTVFNRL